MLLRSVVSILRNQDTEILLVHAETPTPGWTGTFISCGLLPWSGTAAPEGAHPVAGCKECLGAGRSVNSDGLSPGDSAYRVSAQTNVSPYNSYHSSDSEMVLSDRKGLTQQNKNKQAACASRSWAGCQQRRLSMTRLWRSGNGRELMRVPVL